MSNVYPFDTNMLIRGCCSLKKFMIEACYNAQPQLLHSYIIPSEKDQKYTLSNKITPMIACLEAAITQEASTSDGGTNKVAVKLEKCLRYLKELGADNKVPRILLNMCSSMFAAKWWKPFVQEEQD